MKKAGIFNQYHHYYLPLDEKVMGVTDTGILLCFCVNLFVCLGVCTQ